MAASASDKARKTYSFLQKTLNSGISDVDTTLTPNNVTNIPTDTAVSFIVDRVDSSGTLTPTKRELMTGYVSGSTITGLSRGEQGTTAQTHTANAVIEFVNSGEMWNDMIDFMLQDHSNPSGYHKSLTDANGNEWIKQTATSSAVNELTVANAATGNRPQISATGDDTNIGINYRVKGSGAHQLLDGSGNEIIKTGSGVASAVNEYTVTNAATGNAPEIAATGGDSNIDVKLTPKGTGTLKVGGNPISHGAWTSWTPTWTVLTIGNATQACKYTQIGKTVICKIQVTLGSTSSMGSGVPTFTLPVTAASMITSSVLGPARFETSVNSVGNVRYADTTHGDLINWQVSGSKIIEDSFTSTNPGNWGTGSIITAEFRFEAA